MAIPVFPKLPGQAWPLKRSGPVFDTLVQTSVSGKRTAFVRRVTPRWSWELSFGVLRSSGAFAEMRQLSAFFAGCFGAAYPFAFTDAEDNAARDQIFGVGDGAARSFQLVRAFGGVVEPVFLPTGAVAISVDGTPAAAGAYAIDDKGLVSFLAAPAAGAVLTWTGGFDWLCAFDDDQIEFTNLMSGFWSVDKLSFTSVVP